MNIAADFSGIFQEIRGMVQQMQKREKVYGRQGWQEREDCLMK